MVRAAIVSGLTREQRQRLRRTLGRLETNLVRKSTLDRYARTFNEFSEYMQQIYTTWPTSAPEFDKVVSEYLEVLWDAGETKSSAAYTLASIHYFLPQLKHQLPRSWKLKAIWDKLELLAKLFLWIPPLSSLWWGTFTRSKIRPWDWPVSLVLTQCCVQESSLIFG